VHWLRDLESSIKVIAESVGNILGHTEYIVLKFLSFAALLYILYQVVRETFHKNRRPPLL